MSTTEANLLEGSLTHHASGSPVDVINPADGSVVGRVPGMLGTDLEAVLAAATRGAATWKSTSVLERSRILFEAARLIRSEASGLADLIVAEMGKTRAEASGEVGKAAEFFEFYAGQARQTQGEVLADARPHTVAFQIHEPLGTVLLITPWNDPLLTPARKLAPALISGNSVILKPASETPLVALRLAAILNQAGLPAGVLGTVTGRGSEVGPVLTRDPRIAAVSFTGSTAVGRKLQRELAGTATRVQTEMGGKNAAVVLADADLDLAVQVIAAGAFGQAGQRCTATSRLIVERSIAPQVRSRVAAAVEALTLGPGDAGVDLGPVVSRAQQADVFSRVQAGVGEGAEVIAQSPPGAGAAAEGAYVPALFVALDRTNSLWRDEVFGPVLSMIEVDDLGAAIEAANDSAYGLSAAIFTSSLESAHRFIDEVDAGQVSVNQPTSGWDVHQGFGGFKDSGSPFKEQGTVALAFYTRVKTVAMRSRA